MDFITDWVYCFTLYPSATFLRANSALQSFDNLCLTCKLEFPLDVGCLPIYCSNQSRYLLLTSPYIQYGELKIMKMLLLCSLLIFFKSRNVKTGSGNYPSPVSRAQSESDQQTSKYYIFSHIQSSCS